jgi:Tfp pilus assembly protein PilF
MRKLIIVLALFTTVLLAGFVSYRGYKSWKRGHLVSMARIYLANSELKKAYLSLQGALRSDPHNVDACRLMAILAEAEGSPAVIIWRSRVVELAPKSTEDRLALARTAMALRDATTATNALDGIIEDDKHTPAYHNVAGSIAAALNQPQTAEAHFVEAARLDPTNPVPRLNLAVVHLQTTNTQTVAEARAVLHSLRSEPAVRCQALRELLGDALQSRQTNDALTLSKELVAQTNSNFKDCVLRLGVLQVTGQPDFKSSLATYRREAATNSVRLYDLATWQMVRLGPAENLTWLQSLPPSVKTNLPASLLIADCQVATKDWRNLQASLANLNWAEVDFLRHALISRAMREQNLAASSKTEWELTLKAAASHKQNLVMLLRTAAQWRWLSEAEDILWTIVDQNPADKWAAQVLAQALYVGGRTRSLMTLYTQESKRAPSDLLAKNNLAMTALLLEEESLKPHELAREVYSKVPTNSSFASTYAFSLYLEKKPDEALKIIQQMNPKYLEDPTVAGYYGLILKKTGKAADAQKYFALALGTKGPILPEERKLFQKAQSGS